MKARHKRFALILAGLVGLGLVTALVLNAMKGSISYFFTPTDVAEGKAPPNHVFRLGGLVEKGTLKREGNSLKVHFTVTDTAKSIQVAYTGILPDLFREGQGVIAQGKMGPHGEFVADEVLAKHDENYMPPEVAKALEKARQKNAAKL